MSSRYQGNTSYNHFISQHAIPLHTSKVSKYAASNSSYKHLTSQRAIPLYPSNPSRLSARNVSWLLAESSAPTACDTLPKNALKMPIASPPAMVPNHESPTPRIETQLPPPTMDVGLDRKVYAHLPRTEQLALRPKAVLLWLRDMDVTIESAQREGLIPDISMSPEVRDKITSHLIDLSRNLRR